MSAWGKVRRRVRVPLVSTVVGYRREWWRFDMVAGLSLWALAVPQALAYAELAGLPAVAGLYTALAGMAVYAVLGTTRFITVGPESTVALIVAGALAPLAAAGSQRYMALVGLLGLLTGCALLLGALARAGVMTRFLSRPVLSGYMAGAGVVIVIGQLPKAFGFTVSGEHATKLGGFLGELGKSDWVALTFALATIVVLSAARRLAPRLPGALIVLIVATAVVALTPLKDRLAVVGAVEGGAPDIGIDFGLLKWGDVGALAPTAVSLAVFVFATTALTAKAIDPKMRDVDATGEFVALGTASIASAFTGGYPTNSSDTRSVFLAQSGAKTQMANAAGAVMILVTVLALTPLFTYLPNAALAGVILATAVRLIDVSQFARLLRLRTADFLLALITALSVIVTGPIGGIGVGVLASLIEVVRRTVQPHTAVLARVPGPVGAWRDVTGIDTPEAVPGVVVIRFDAPVFFANADLLRDRVMRQVAQQGEPVVAVVISAEGITDLDITGAEAIERLADDLAANGVRLYFARLRSSVRALMESTGVLEKIGADRVYLRIDDAVRSAVGDAL